MEIGVAMMVRVSRSEDMGMALKAAQWLVKYAEELRKAKEETAGGVSPNGHNCGCAETGRFG
jgi:hypothetical protein